MGYTVSKEQNEISTRLQEIIHQLQDEEDLKFGQKSMDNKTRELLKMNLKNTLAIAKLIQWIRFQRSERLPTHFFWSTLDDRYAAHLVIWIVLAHFFLWRCAFFLYKKEPIKSPFLKSIWVSIPSHPAFQLLFLLTLFVQLFYLIREWKQSESYPTIYQKPMEK